MDRSPIAEWSFALVVVATSCGFVPRANAWGSEGHRIAAETAEQFREPATARQVRDLLALQNATTLAQVSTWAEDIRGQRRDTVAQYVLICQSLLSTTCMRYFGNRTSRPCSLRTLPVGLWPGLA